MCVCVCVCVYIITFTKYTIVQNGFHFPGLKNVYYMTKGVETELRFDLERSTGAKGYGVWQSFSLSEPSNYSLQIGAYSGTIGNTIIHYYCINTRVTRY